MDQAYEDIFVDKFISKNKRPRIAYELSNSKKRNNAISRFCHNSLNYIDEARIIYAGNKIGFCELNDLIKKYTKAKQCYLISIYSDIDGTFLNREEALNRIIGAGMAGIMVFENIIVIETEQVQDPAMKYVLFSEK